MNGERLRRSAKMLEGFRTSGHLDSTDICVATYIAEAITTEPTRVELLGLAAATRATQLGFVCVDLGNPASLRGIHEKGTEVEAVGAWPSIDEWISGLGSSAFAHRVETWDAAAGTERPLVLKGTLLYTARQWEDERTVARSLGRRFSESPASLDTAVVDALFPGADSDDLQVSAVRNSLRNRTFILMGGPGTGKTFTIARIISAALSIHGESLRVALAAPTAKAATQMRESLLNAVGADDHPFPPSHVEIFRRLDPTTLHRLLGRRPRTENRFAHDIDDPLDVDLVVVDETSMVSLPLMARFLEALPLEARLVLVGDPGQLASVENGSVLPDLAEMQDELPEIMTRLTVSQRNRDSDSSVLTEAIRLAEWGRIGALLTSVVNQVDDTAMRTLAFVEVDDGLKGAGKKIGAVLRALGVVKTKAENRDVEGALDAAAAIRILCAHRHGAFGVEAWNEFVLDKIFDKDRHWRAGNIVVKTRNDVTNGLANGDTGVVIEFDGQLCFAFRHGAETIVLPTSAVDDVSVAFATTVHKAQGSEFATVVVVVPPASSPLCTRELLYTAATRAKPNLMLIGSRADIEHAVRTPQQRFSGLVDRLRAG
ncbi:MAG: exodeoxyribonuclease V subunit alpha [Actinomycetota bacterium]